MQGGPTTQTMNLILLLKAALEPNELHDQVNVIRVLILVNNSNLKKISSRKKKFKNIFEIEKKILIS